jgi:hypothetical protein
MLGELERVASSSGGLGEPTEASVGSRRGGSFRVTVASSVAGSRARWLGAGHENDPPTRRPTSTSAPRTPLTAPDASNRCPCRADEHSLRIPYRPFSRPQTGAASSSAMDAPVRERRCRRAAVLRGAEALAGADRALPWTTARSPLCRSDWARLRVSRPALTCIIGVSQGSRRLQAEEQQRRRR